MKKGKLIVIDGIDNSGKATQTKILARRLRKEGKKVQVIDFPRYYHNHFGELIGECLSGKHGDFLKLDPYITSVLYAADRFESSEKIKDWLKNGNIVIVDRYVSANQIHQGGKITDAKERKQFIAWVDRMEYGIFEIPRPDLIIYLEVPLAVSLELGKKNVSVGKKDYLKGGRDAHEGDRNHLEKSRASALVLIRGNRKWQRISCVEKGRIMSKEKISGILWDKVKRIIS